MCRKGENIRKRKDGRWEARFIKYRDSEGKIHYGSIYGKTYSEVKAKRNKKIAELPQYGYHTGNSGVLNYQATFQTAAIRWQQDIRYTIKDSTFPITRRFWRTNCSLNWELRRSAKLQTPGLISLSIRKRIRNCLLEPFTLL